MKVWRQDNPPSNKTAFAIADIGEGFVKSNIFGVHFDNSVIAIHVEDVTVPVAAHA
jgi:hypothetical protein